MYVLYEEIFIFIKIKLLASRLSNRNSEGYRHEKIN